MIVSVRSNFKGASASEPWSESLLSSNLITGPNGSGKSRVVEAIALALTGSVPDYLGRTSVRDPKMLWRAKPKGKGSLFVELTLTDGRVIRWEQARSNGKASRTIDGELWSGSGLGTVFGVSEVRENLFGSPKRAEKWLADQLGLTLHDVFVGLESTVSQEQLQLARSLRDAKGITEVDPFLKSIKGAAREAKSQAKAAQALVEELEHVAGAYVSDSELGKAREALTAANQAQEEALVMYDRVGELQSLHQTYLLTSEELSKLPEPPSESLGALACATPLKLALERVVAQFPNNAACPCCHKGLDNGAESLRFRIRELSDYIENATATSQLVDKRASVMVRMKAAKQEGEHLLSLIPPNMLPNPEANPTETALEVAKLRVGQAQAHLDELQRRRISSQSPGMAQATVDQSARKSEEFAALATVCEEIVEQKVESTLGAFNDALALAYPPHFGVPTLSIRPQVAVALKRGGTTTGVPSGGEEALLLLAIAGVLAYLRAQRDGGDGTNILVMDDRGVDAQTLGAIIDLWGHSEWAQVFIPTTTQCPSQGDADLSTWNVVSYWPNEPEKKMSGDGDFTYNVDPFSMHP